jgi:hypothetical protein
MGPLIAWYPRGRTGIREVANKAAGARCALERDMVGSRA